MRLRSSLFLLALAATTAPAWAITDGWDVKVEVLERIWTEPALQWAASIHSDNPTVDEVAQTVSPPPRELWCVDENVVVNCDAWEAHMDIWLHHFLKIPYRNPLPALPPWPKECPSECEGF